MSSAIITDEDLANELVRVEQQPPPSNLSQRLMDDPYPQLESEKTREEYRVNGNIKLSSEHQKFIKDSVRQGLLIKTRLEKVKARLLQATADDITNFAQTTNLDTLDLKKQVNFDNSFSSDFKKTATFTEASKQLSDIKQDMFTKVRAIFITCFEQEVSNLGTQFETLFSADALLIKGYEIGVAKIKTNFKAAAPAMLEEEINLKELNKCANKFVSLFAFELESAATTVPTVEIERVPTPLATSLPPPPIDPPARQLPKKPQHQTVYRDSHHSTEYRDQGERDRPPWPYDSNRDNHREPSYSRSSQDGPRQPANWDSDRRSPPRKHLKRN
jgi:hypothetical protein